MEKLSARARANRRWVDTHLFQSERTLAEIIMVSETDVISLCLRARREYDNAPDAVTDENPVIVERAFDAAYVASYLWGSDPVRRIDKESYETLMAESNNIYPEDIDDVLREIVEMKGDV